MIHPTTFDACVAIAEGMEHKCAIVWVALGVVVGRADREFPDEQVPVEVLFLAARALSLEEAKQVADSWIDARRREMEEV